tara:strand:+ start:1357 stop:1707 length:351 start_codon:yes stop_codon:yes gene_type:complete
MLKINKNELSVLNVNDVRKLDNCGWFNNDEVINKIDFILEEGVYVSNNGSRGENEIEKVELDSDGNFEVDCLDDLKEIMGGDDDMIMSEWVKDGSVYSVVLSDECWSEYFYYSGGV